MSSLEVIGEGGWGSKTVHQGTRASPGDHPGPPIHCSPLDPARFSAPGTLHRPPEACRDGPRAMPGPKMGSKSVSNRVSNQIRGFNSGRKTRSRTPHFASLISHTTPLISSEMKPEGCGLTDEKWRRAIRNARCEMRKAVANSTFERECPYEGRQRFFFGVGGSGRRPFNV